MHRAPVTPPGPERPRVRYSTFGSLYLVPCYLDCWWDGLLSPFYPPPGQSPALPRENTMHRQRIRRMRGHSCFGSARLTTEPKQGSTRQGQQRLEPR